MTPPAAGAATARTRHRPATRRGVSPRAPRRVSGPASRSARLSANGGAVALPRAGGRIALPVPPGLPRRALRRASSLADHRLLERLLTGRAWIALIAVALIGLVFTQVSLLKLNAGIGAAVERSQQLERSNAELRATVSGLGSNDRIQRLADRLGMVLPPAGSVTFLGRDGRRIGGDGLTALASGTPTGAEPAGTNGVAPQTAEQAAATAAAAPTGQATPATAPQQTPPAQPTPAASAQAATTPAATPSPTPAATATAAPAQQQPQQQQPTQPTPIAAPSGGATPTAGPQG